MIFFLYERAITVIFSWQREIEIWLKFSRFALEHYVPLLWTCRWIRTWVHTRVWLSTRSCRFLSKTTEHPRSDRFVWRRVRCFDILLCSVWVPSYLESETISWYAPTEPHTSLSSHPQLHPQLHPRLQLRRLHLHLLLPQLEQERLLNHYQNIIIYFILIQEKFIDLLLIWKSNFQKNLTINLSEQKLSH